MVKARSETSLLTKSEAKKALAKATVSLRALLKKSERNAWVIGKKLTDLDALGVPATMGYGSAADYANDELGIPRSTAFLYMRAAGAFSQSIVATFGVTKLNRALAYIAATPEEETAHDVPTLKVRVPDANGQVHEKPFADTTVADLETAARHEREVHAPTKRAKKNAAITPAIASSVTKANRALDRAVGKSNADLANVAVRTHDGEVLVDVHGVPVGTIAKALAGVAKAFKRRFGPV